MLEIPPKLHPLPFLPLSLQAAPVWTDLSLSRRVPKHPSVTALITLTDVALASLEGDPVSYSPPCVYHSTVLVVLWALETFLLARQMPGPNSLNTEEIVVEYL